MRLLANVLHTYLRPGMPDYQLVVAAEGGTAFTIVVKDGVAAIQEGSTEGADRLAGPPEELVLLFYGRITLADALARGGYLTGDQSRVQALLDHQDKP